MRTEEDRRGDTLAEAGRVSIERADDRGSGVVRFTVTGPLRPDELRDTLAELYATHPPELPRRFFWDLRGADIDWSSDEIRSFAGWVRANRLPGDGRTAVVVDRDFHFGLARMYEVFSADLPVEFVVFRDVEAATAWMAH